MASKHGSRLMSVALEVRQKIYVDVFSEASISCFEQAATGYLNDYDGGPAALMSVDESAKNRGITVVPDDGGWY